MCFCRRRRADDRYDLFLLEINAYVLYNIKLVIALAQVDDLYQLSFAMVHLPFSQRDNTPRP